MPKSNQEIPKAYRITLRLVAALLFVIALLFTFVAARGMLGEGTRVPGDWMFGVFVNGPEVSPKECGFTACLGYFFSVSLVVLSWPQKKATKHGKQ